jgi:hypothetical protein
LVVVCCLDYDGAGGGGREACAVGGDVVDGVGCDAARVDDDVGHELAVEEGFDVEVERKKRSWLVDAIERVAWYCPGRRGTGRLQ